MFRILVVDDDHDINKSVCLFLEKNGYEVKGCLSADDAFNEMYGNPFDLIISDIMMPKIDGYEFAKRIRNENNDIPILFMGDLHLVFIQHFICNTVGNHTAFWRILHGIG